MSSLSLPGFFEFFHGKLLTVDAAVLVANNVAICRLDYCNSLLYGVSSASVAEFQKVQNALCCIVFRLDRITHVISHLEKLDLPLISRHIPFQISLLRQ